MNFKGGSGKTTTSAHLAHNLALHGYRTLAIDLDPQASLSALFGTQPELDVGPNDTLYGAIRYDDQRRSISEIVRGTYIPTLHLIPAHLELMEFEHETPRALMTRGAGIRCFLVGSRRRSPKRRTFTMSLSSTAPLSWLSDIVSAQRRDSRPHHRAPANARCVIDGAVSNTYRRSPGSRRRCRRNDELRLV